MVGEADNGDEAVAVTSRELPDVVLMDIRMPGSDGLDATRRIGDDDPLSPRYASSSSPRSSSTSTCSRRCERAPAGSS